MAVIDELQPGQRFAHYEVLGKIGHGGFATVYRVREDRHREEQALKLSHGAVGHGEQAQRALREVEVLRTLTNRHVVRINGAGVSPDGRVFIAMELLQGRQLDRAYDLDHPLQPTSALRIIHQASMGLAEAHALGIVHRDLKPENIWLEPEGNVKVIDFGLARAWDITSGAAANVTIGQHLVGTPHYMQPEQLQTSRLTPASDVYSLATLLYELLTGRSVYFDDAPLSAVRERFRDTPVEWLTAHAHRPVVPIERHLGKGWLPDSVVELIDRCLAKQPEARLPDAIAVSHELGTILHYDYGLLPGALVRVVHPYGGEEERLLLPGTHRIGTDASCDLRLPTDGIEGLCALLEWDGAPDRPRVRPIGGADVRLDGERIADVAVQLRDDSRLQIGPYRLELQYG